ncbi:unnamed protein product [Closterium sp. NIES-54]
MIPRVVCHVTTFPAHQNGTWRTAHAARHMEPCSFLAPSFPDGLHVPPASPHVPPASPHVPPASPHVPPASPHVPPASPHVSTCLSPCANVPLSFPPPSCLSPCVHLSLRFPLSYANTLMPSHLPCFFPPHTQVVPFNPAVDVAQGLYLRFNSALKAANPYSLLTPPSLPPHTQAVPSDPAVDVTLGLYLRFNSALKAANPAIKTLLSISGDFVITNLFDNAASSPSSRSAFIQSAIALARKYNFDGLDLNLAYTTGNATLVSALLTDFRAAIESKAAVSGKSELLLSAIISAYEWTETLSYDVPTLNKTLDFVHVPTFDLHGSSKRKTGMHTALQDLSNPKRSIKGAMAAWVSRGLARSKAMLGLAMYGRTFTLDSTSSTVGAPAFGAGQSGSISQVRSNSCFPFLSCFPPLLTYSRTILCFPYVSFLLSLLSQLQANRSKQALITLFLVLHIPYPSPPLQQEPGILFYKEIDELVTTGGYTATFDAPTSSMYAVKGDQWVGHDDPSTIATKVQFANSQGYGGWFFWALGQDANNALLNAAVAA